MIYSINHKKLESILADFYLQFTQREEQNLKLDNFLTEPSCIAVRELIM